MIKFSQYISQLGNRIIHTLGYADDAALVDTDPETVTQRVTKIAKGSREDADMHISVPKTEVMHIQTQEKAKVEKDEAV